MSLRDKIEESYKSAIKSGDTDAVSTLRLIKSAIKDKDIEARTSGDDNKVDDNKILTLLQNLIKQRNDSIISFEKASRKDLIENEKKEILIISNFLPQQLSEEDTKIIINKIIKENNFSSIKDMGKVMNCIKDSYSGSIDMSIAGKLAKEFLNN